jgi:hypothetical protein
VFSILNTSSKYIIKYGTIIKTNYSFDFKYNKLITKYEIRCDDGTIFSNIDSIVVRNDSVALESHEPTISSKITFKADLNSNKNIDELISKGIFTKYTGRIPAEEGT